ncbi:unnamed protein product [Symbiodinium natans]|uniref:Uncharacterized protein n=1 Tax=Symbiodinium natans TaxID=878477 RepID=A0A812LD16_9DINO|nr:unnamed protein product [Symbiodinium natans]
MSRGFTTAALVLACGASFIISPVMIFRAEWLVRKTGALAPNEKFHPIAKRFLVAFEMTVLSLAGLAARSCAVGDAADRVFWARIMAIPCASLCTTLSLFGYEKDHAFHNKHTGAKAFGGLTTALLLGGVAFPETDL